MILDFIGKFFTVLNPLWYGIAFAFLLAPAYNRLRKHMHKVFASIICLIILLIIFALIGFLIIPQLIDSISMMIKHLPEYIKAIDVFVNGIGENYPDLSGVIETYYGDFNTSFNNWINTSLVPNMSSYMATLSAGVVNILVFFKDFIIGIIFMVYCLNIKDKLSAQAVKICYSHFRIERANTIVDDCRYIKDVFSKFIVGKIIDSAIIAILTFIIITIFDMPYKFIISLFVGITNIIPFFGPFIGAIPSAFLLLLVSPIKCLEFCIIILILQQLDGNFIGPKILGQSTGISSFWVLVSVLLFGGLFGIVGMIIAVPSAAVITRWIKRGAENRLKKRELQTETESYENLESIDPNTKEYKRKS